MAKPQFVATKGTGILGKHGKRQHAQYAGSLNNLQRCGHVLVVQVQIFRWNRKHLQAEAPYKYWATHSRLMTNLELQSPCPKSATTHRVYVGVWILEEPTS